MGDLQVDYEELETGGGTLKRLKSTFDSLPDQTSHQSSGWGSSDISGAMEEFATNWDYRRDILSGKLQEVGEKFESTLEAFRKADEKLADGLEEAMHGDGKGGS